MDYPSHMGSAGTFAVEVVPADLYGKILNVEELKDYEAVNVSLWPDKPEEYVVYKAAQKGGEAPEELLRFVVMNGIVASDSLKGSQDQPFTPATGPVVVTGVILTPCRMGERDGYLAVSTTKPPVILAHLAAGSLGLDREKLEGSRTAKDFNAAFGVRLAGGPRSIRGLSNRVDPLAGTFRTPKLVGQVEEEPPLKVEEAGFGAWVRRVVPGLFGRKP